MVPDAIERDIFIDAPVEVVWRIVTEAEHIGSWFSDSAEIDLRPGGAATLTWDKHGTFPGRIEKVEPMRSVSFRWARPAGAEPRDGNSTLVEFRLSPEGEGTRLRVVESGFRSLDVTDEAKETYFAENTRGWEIELGELGEYAAKQAVSSRR